MENLKIVTSQNSNPKSTAISLKGELCAMDAIQFKLISLNKVSKWSEDIALDLKGISKVDLTGINSLAKLNFELIRKGKRLSIELERNNPFKKLLHLTKLSGSFNIHYAA